MSSERDDYDLRCPACGWSGQCAPEEMARWLVQAGKLRSKGWPEREVLVELFRTSASAFVCPECRHQGMIAAPAAEDLDWPGPVYCASCRRPIPRERLEAIPGTKLCAACQGAEESGHGRVETEYCPRCGAPMALRPTRGGGLTRYRMACTATPPCRLS